LRATNKISMRLIHITNLLNIITAKKTASIGRQTTRAVYKSVRLNLGDSESNGN
jgi:hypothetical protein